MLFKASVKVIIVHLVVISVVDYVDFSNKPSAGREVPYVFCQAK